MQHEVAGFDAVLDILEKEEWRRTTLHANHAYLKDGLDKLGYNVEASKSQIIALEAGDIRQTTTLRDALGIARRVRSDLLPPATPEKRCIIRFTLNCGLTPPRARLHHRGLRRHSPGGGYGRVALDKAQGARSGQGRGAQGHGCGGGRGRAGRSALCLPGSGGLDGGRLHDWQVYREGGANVGRGPARDRAPAALDNHPAE